MLRLLRPIDHRLKQIQLGVVLTLLDDLRDPEMRELGSLTAAGLFVQRLGQALVGEAPGVSLTVTDGVDVVRSVATQLAVPCGYGSAVPLAQLSQGLSQARAALELAFDQGGVVGPSGVTSLEGLLEQQPAGRLDPFVDQLIGPLVVSDRRRGTEHITTLRSFVANNGSLHRTAGEQYLHVNTVRHRLTRVRELTGRDPLYFSDRVVLPATSGEDGGVTAGEDVLGI